MGKAKPNGGGAPCMYNVSLVMMWQMTLMPSYQIPSFENKGMLHFVLEQNTILLHQGILIILL